MKLVLRLFTLITLFSLFTIRCANQGSLEGGPKDSIPPLVVRTTPAMYTTNFKGKKILIEFDEYIQLKDQSKNFVMSPPGDQKPRMTIKGKGLEIAFENDLDSATTYRLDFGSAIVDNNESNPLDGFSFVFSTGNVIDSLFMVGQAISALERDSVVKAYIMYFDAKADSQELDSTMFNGKIEAVFRTDSSGYFVADILKDKSYRIYALDDQNGNQKYEPGTDRIGFVDGTFNPTDLDGFSMTYDSVRKYMKIDPLQVKFELFKEIPVQRQLIMKQERPLRQKIVMSFKALNPVIDSVKLEGIDPQWIIREDGIIGDTVTLWIAPPTKEHVESLKDTIRGTLLLQKEDSVWNKITVEEKLAFTHKIVEPKDKKTKDNNVARSKKKRISIIRRIFCKKSRLAYRAMRDSTAMNVGMVDSLGNPLYDSLGNPLIARDSSVINTPEEKSPSGANDTSTEDKKEESKFKFSVKADRELIPTNNIVFKFDLPLRTSDTSKITLHHTETYTVGKGRDAKEEKRELVEPFTFEQTPGDIRQWVLKANWKPKDSYRLVIEPGALEDISFESNDSLESKFTIADPEKFGELIITTNIEPDYDGSYIMELYQGSGDKITIISRKKGIKGGEKIDFPYVKAGGYYLRVIRDVNNNGKWDTGSLTERRYPEKVRVVSEKSGRPKLFLSKENWQITEEIDLVKLFE